MDENIVYFESLLPRLRGIYMHNVWVTITRMIAKRIHSTTQLPSDWKDFVAEIGVNNALVLEDIEIAAATQRELPLNVAFSSLLQGCCKLHDVIRALIRLERADILCLIREEFNAFLEEWESGQILNAHASSCHDYAARATNKEFPEVNLSLTIGGTSSGNFTVTDGSASSGNLSGGRETETCDARLVGASKFASAGNYYSGEQKADELIANAEKKDSTEGKDSAQEYIDSLELNKKLEDIPVIKCSCKCPKELKVALPKPSDKKPEPISVFVPYVQSQKMIAIGIKFANLLRRAGFRVVTISEAEFIIRIDRSGALKALLEKVDFVVPVISEEYIAYARPSGKLLRFNDDAKTNRFIFTWIHSEYENNYCFNVRVKPVVVEGFDRQLIEKEPIFQWVHQLWNEVDRLVGVLRDTKQMMQGLMESWDQEEFVNQWMSYLNQSSV